MELQGIVTNILPETSGVSSSGDWVRQEVVIEYEQGKYPKKIVLNFFNKSGWINQINVGMKVLVKFSIEAKEQNGRWFNSVNGYGIDIVGVPIHQTEAERNHPSQPDLMNQPNHIDLTPEQTDDLPF